MTRRAVLIISADPLAAALLAAAVELAGHAPFFPHQGEASRDALRRVRPRLVVVDCDHDEGCSDEFIGPALMMEARVLLFRSRRTRRDMTRFAERLGLSVVDMSLEHDHLSRILRGALDD